MGLFDKLKKTVTAKVQQSLSDSGIDLNEIRDRAQGLMNQTRTMVNDVRSSVNFPSEPTANPTRTEATPPQPQPASGGSQAKPNPQVQPQSKFAGFSTDMVKVVLAKKGKHFKVDDDGDIRVDEDRTREYPYKTFIWLLISDDHITIDFGMSNAPEGMDAEAVAEQFNANATMRMYNATAKDNGTVRAKKRIEASMWNDMAEDYVRKMLGDEYDKAVKASRVLVEYIVEDVEKRHVVFTSDMVKNQLMNALGNGYECSVDDDGDVKFDEKDGATSHRFSHFGWVYVKPYKMTFDWRFMNFPDNNVDELVSKFNARGGLLEAEKTSKGKISLKAVFKNDSFSSQAEFAAECGRVVKATGEGYEYLCSLAGIKPELGAMVFTSQLINGMLDSNHTACIVDSDGDIKIVNVDKSCKFIRFVWLYVKPDKVVFDCGVSGMPGNLDLNGAAERFNREYDYASATYTEKFGLRIRSEIQAAKFMENETDRLKSFMNTKLQEMWGAWVHIWKYLGLEYEKKQLNITTDFMTKLLRDLSADYEVDSDGDIRVDYSSSSKIPFNWFVWYYPHGDSLGIDSGEKGIPRSADISSAVNMINSAKSGLLTVKMDSDGDARIRASINGSDCDDLVSFARKWDAIHGQIPLIWQALAKDAGLFDSNRSSSTGYSSSYSSSSSRSSSSSSSRSGSSRSSSSSSSSNSAAREAAAREREAERERKEDLKRWKESELRRLQGQIDDIERIIEGYKRNLEMFRRNRDQRSVKGYQEEIKRRRARISEIRERMKEVRAKK